MSNSAIKSLRVVDHEVPDPPRPDDLATISAPLTSMLTAELDEAQRYLGIPTEEIVIAALGRTIARAIGEGDVTVDVTHPGRFTLALACMGTRKVSATATLYAVHSALATRLPTPTERPDVFFSYLGSEHAPAALPCQGHAFGLRVYRRGTRLQMDWWYDSRRLDRHTVEEFTEQFPLALIELTSEATPINGAAEMVMAG